MAEAGAWRAVAVRGRNDAGLQLPYFTSRIPLDQIERDRRRGRPGSKLPPGGPRELIRLNVNIDHWKDEVYARMLKKPAPERLRLLRDSEGSYHFF
jgi:hypothetical protein